MFAPQSLFILELIQLQNGQERLLRYFHITDLFHSFLTSFLFFQQFTLTAHVTAITLRALMVSLEIIFAPIAA